MELPNRYYWTVTKNKQPAIYYMFVMETTDMEKSLPECPVETTLLMISDKWKVLILRDLMNGTKRFGELKK